MVSNMMLTVLDFPNFDQMLDLGPLIYYRNALNNFKQIICLQIFESENLKLLEIVCAELFETIEFENLKLRSSVILIF